MQHFKELISNEINRQNSLESIRVKRSLEVGKLKSMWSRTLREFLIYVQFDSGFLFGANEQKLVPFVDDPNKLISAFTEDKPLRLNSGHSIQVVCSERDLVTTCRIYKTSQVARKKDKLVYEARTADDAINYLLPNIIKNKL